MWLCSNKEAKADVSLDHTCLLASLTSCVRDGQQEQEATPVTHTPARGPTSIFVTELNDPDSLDS